MTLTRTDKLVVLNSCYLKIDIDAVVYHKLSQPRAKPRITKTISHFSYRQKGQTLLQKNKHCICNSLMLILLVLNPNYLKSQKWILVSKFYAGKS